MISVIEGNIIENTGGEMVIMTTGGVGYKLFASSRLVEKYSVGSSALIDVYLVVREDALDLFGFYNTSEKELFKNFLSVNGVGPKTALHLLALGTVEEITSAIARGDIDFLTKVSGIGKKTAERIVVDLKSKLIEMGTNYEPVPQEYSRGILGDVIDGLIALGYSVGEARTVVNKLDSNGKTSEQLLKEALQNIK
jgi:Holliday junction DNA helicase RuvA